MTGRVYNRWHASISKVGRLFFFQLHPNMCAPFHSRPLTSTNSARGMFSRRACAEKAGEWCPMNQSVNQIEARGERGLR